MTVVNKTTIRPPSLIGTTSEHLRSEVQNFLQFIWQSHNTLNGVTIQAPATNQGFSVQSGTTSVTGSKLSIPTTLAKVIRVTASIDSGTTATNFTVSARPSPLTLGAIDIFVWMPTAAGDTTPIAATSAATVHWWATGTPGTPT